MSTVPEWAPLATIPDYRGDPVQLVMCRGCGCLTVEGDGWRTHLNLHAAQTRAAQMSAPPAAPARGW